MDPQPLSARFPHARLPRSGRRGMSFCYAIIAFTALVTLGAVFLELATNSMRWSYKHFQQQEAFYLAEAGAERSLWMMRQSAAGEDNINLVLALSTEEAEGGVTRTYTSPLWTVGRGRSQFTAIAPHERIPGTVEIHGLGLSREGLREDVMVVVRRDLTPEELLGTGIEAVTAHCFDYALFSDHNLTIEGAPLIDGNAEDGGAGVYANGHIVFEDYATQLVGRVWATGTITGRIRQTPRRNGRIQYCPREIVPEISLSYYSAIADEQLGAGGPVTINGANGALGTYEDPWVIYVDGQASVSGTLTGIGMIVASGGLVIAGDVNYGTPESAWALVTTGACEMSGSPQVHGLIYCHNANDGGASFTAQSGTPTVHGSVVADVLNLRSDFRVEWDPNPTRIWALPGTAIDGAPPALETLSWERT